RGDGRAHDVHHRPPAVDDRARGRDRRTRARAPARAWRPRRAAGELGAVRRNRRQGASRPGLPPARPAARARGERAMSPAGPRGGGGPGLGRPQWAGERASRGSRGRNLRGLLTLLRPYKARTAAMFAALIVGTAASLAPPLLAKVAID